MEIPIVLALVGIAFLIAAGREKPTESPDRREYPVSVTIGQVIIHQLIVTEIPVPFRPLLGSSRGLIESGIGDAPMVRRISAERRAGERGRIPLARINARTRRTL
jgi:hypothetical protein